MDFGRIGLSALLIVLPALLAPRFAVALGELPQTFTLDGKLYSDAAGTVPLSDTGSLIIQIMDPAQACVLYEESQSFDVTQSQGFFHVSVGSALGAPKRGGTSGLDSNNAMALVYANVNSTGIPGKSLGGGGCTYIPVSGDARFLRVTVLTDRDHASRTLSPNMTLDTTPYAVVAERAETLRGLGPANFLQLDTPGNPNLTQANLESLLTNLSALQSLAAGNSTAYMTSGAGGGARLPQPTTPPTNVNAAATEGQIWYDPSSHQVHFSDGSTIQTVGDAGSGITNLSLGAGLTSTAGTTISTGGQTISLNTGTAANQIVKLDGSARLPAVDGSLLTGVNASAISAGTLGVGVNTGASIQTTSFVQAAEGRVASLKMTGNGNYVEQRAPAALASNYSLTWPLALPGAGTTQVLTADSTGQLTWVDLNAGLVSNQASLGAGQIWIGDGSGKAQARSTSSDVALTQAGAFKVTAIQNVGVSSVAPGASGQVLRYDGVANQYVPTFVAMTDLRSKTTGTSSFGTSCSSSQTLTYDAVTDTMACQNISLGAGQLQAGSVATAALANDAVTSAKINSTGIAINRLLITDAMTGANVTYAACATNEILKFGSTGWVCSSVAALAPVTSVAGKTGAVTLNANDIDGLGTAALLDFGTAATQLPQLDSLARLPAVDGSLLVNVNAAQMQSRAIASLAPAADQVLTWNAIGVQWEPRTLPTSPVQSVAGRTGSVVLYADDLTSATGHNLTYKPDNVACANGQVLKWDGTQWSCGSDNDAGGDITSVAAGTGLLGGGVTGAVTLSVDVGTAANKLVQLNGSAQVPAVDGSLLTNVNAVRLRSVAVSATAPTANQVLKFNAASTNWEPGVDQDNGITTLTGDVSAAGPGSAAALIAHNAITSVKINDVGVAVNRLLITDATTGGTVKYADQCAVGEILKWTSTGWTCAADSGATGFVSSIATGTGLLGGPITSAGTLNVDVGTSANKILQLNASAQIPAVDGSLLTQVNAIRLQTRAVASTAPVTGQVLGWNNGSAQWEPVTAALGSVTNVATGTGLLGGPITSTGTLNVDVGTSANKIVQLNASAQLPAVDGSLLNQINAVKLQTRAISAAAPSNAQVLAFNAVTAQWEPSTATTGTLTSVATGTGLLGGPITSTGTLNVDVGTSANKIVQLNASAQLPAVDGSLLTQITAVKLQTRSVSSALPANAQVLAYNAVSLQWEPSNVTNGTVTSVATGTGLLGGPITSTGTLNVDVGTAANKIVQLNATAQLPAIDGSLLTQINAVKLQTRAVSSALPANAQVLAYNSVSAQWEPSTATTGTLTSVASGVGLLGGPITSTGTLNVDVGTSANKVVQLNASAQLPAVDGSLLTQTNAVKLQTRAVASTAPNAGQVLGWNGLSNQWEPTTASTGSVVSVSSGVGLLGGPITSTGTLNVDVGTVANKIPQLNASAQLALGNGSAGQPSHSFADTATGMYSPGTGQLSLATSGTARLSILTNGFVGVGSTNPGVPLDVVGDVRTTTAFYAPVAFLSRVQSNSNTPAQPGFSFVFSSDSGMYETAAGSHAVAFSTSGVERTRITAGGLIGIGTTAPQAALDVTSVGTSSALLVPRDTLTNRPSGVNGMIRYNTSNNALETFVGGAWANFAVGTGVGTVQSIASGTGLLGGPITANGTLTVDVGTTANKIVQLNGSAQLAAIDGSLLTQVNAVKLQGRTVATTAPGTGQYLGWNGLTSQWEPVIDGGGTVTSLATGTGLVGGTITAVGTLSVDVGSAAGKIVQENAGAQIAQIQGAAATPAYTFVGDLNTGIYSPASDQLTLATNGTAQLLVNSNGNVGIGTLLPQGGLDVFATGTSSSLLIPRDTTANRPTGVNGMVRYNTTNAAVETFVNGAWQNVATGNLYLPLTGGTMSGVISATNGSVSAPGIAMASGSNTGIFSTGAGNLSFAAAGTARLSVTTTGVGFGTTSPRYPLDVVGNVFFGSGYPTNIPTAPLNLVNSAGSTLKTQLALINTAGGSNAGSAIDFYTYDYVTTNPGLRIAAIDNNWSASFVVYSKNPGSASNSLVDRFHILEGGMVGINKAAPAYQLDVVGDVNTTTVYRIGGTQICSSTGCTSSSDVRLKQNIRPLESALDKVLKLNGVSWDWIDKNKYGPGEQVGFIAQDLERVFPEVVKTDTENGLKSVAYGNLVAPVVEAIKILYQRITGQEARLTALEIENAELKAKIQRDEHRLDELAERLRRLEAPVR